MKKVALKIMGLIAVLSLIFTTNCKKIQDGPVPITDVIDTTKGKIEFTLNDNKEKMFRVNNQIIKNKIVINGKKFKQVENQLIPYHSINIFLTNKILSKQKIFICNYANNIFSDSTKTWATFSTSGGDGSGTCESFEVNEKDSLNNFVQITKQQNDFKEIWGNFSVSFNKTRDCAANFYPNTIVIRNGNFHVFVE
jgi:hypothetical protein